MLRSHAQQAGRGTPRRLAAFLVALAPVVGACDDGPSGIERATARTCEPAAEMIAASYDLTPVHDTLIWYQGTPLQDLDAYPQDDDGVILFDTNGRSVYNMIQVAWKGLAFAANYQSTGAGIYLDRAVAHAEVLLDSADLIDDALFFSYDFDFPLHGNGDETMRAPWYSGMGQGVGMSLLLRLYALTGDARYREAADLVMPTFGRIAPDSPFVATIDCDGYYWIDEYPREPPTRTLNGFIFGLMGLYEYWRATGDPEAHRLVQAALATAKRYFPQYRVPGGVSYYCQLHHKQFDYYHLVHIEQLLYLYWITRDPFFWETLEAFADDVDFEIPDWWRRSTEEWAASAG